MLTAAEQKYMNGEELWITVCSVGETVEESVGNLWERLEMRPVRHNIWVFRETETQHIVSKFLTSGFECRTNHGASNTEQLFSQWACNSIGFRTGFVKIGRLGVNRMDERAFFRSRG